MPRAACPPCVCLSTGKATKIELFEPGISLVSLIRTLKRRLLAQKKIRELRWHRAFQGRPCFAKRPCMHSRAAIPIYGNVACNLDRKPVQKGGYPLAWAQGKAP